MIFVGLPLISLCHQTILDRRLAGAESHVVGVDLAVTNYSNSSTTVSPWHQHSKTESTSPESLQIDFGGQKISFWEKCQANLVKYLLKLGIIQKIENISET